MRASPVILSPSIKRALQALGHAFDARGALSAALRVERSSWVGGNWCSSWNDGIEDVWAAPVILCVGVHGALDLLGDGLDGGGGRG